MSVEDIRNHNEWTASFSIELVEQDKIVRKFLREKMYNHPSLQKDRIKSRKIIKELFSGLMENILLLPANIQEICDKKDKTKIAYAICDYIASMTDRSIIENHAKITGTNEFTDQERLV
jgi:dGTPase